VGLCGVCRYRIVGSRNKEVAEACGIMGGGDRGACIPTCTYIH
jgi:hypothetical protein